MLERDAREWLCSTVCTVCTLTAPNVIKKKQQQCKERRRQKRSVSTAHQWSNGIVSFSQSCSSSHSLRRTKFVLRKCVREERGEKNKVEKMRAIEIGTPTFVSFYPTKKTHAKYFHRLEARIFSFSRESNEIVFSSDGKYFEFLRVTQANEMLHFFSKPTECMLDGTQITIKYQIHDINSPHQKGWMCTIITLIVFNYWNARRTFLNFFHLFISKTEHSWKRVKLKSRLGLTLEWVFI